MVWLGLLIGLLSALVASFSELKYPKHIKPWSRAFVFRNRFKVIAAAFSTVGFLAAAITLLEEHSKSEEAAQHLRAENDQLKALMLSGKSVSPTAHIIIMTSAPMHSTDSREERRWTESVRPMMPVRPLGFVPSAVRRELFPLAKPDPLLPLLGEVNFNASPTLRFSFSVQENGAAVTATALDQHSLRTSMLKTGDGQLRVIKFELKVNNKLDALTLFDGLVDSYNQNLAPLEVEIYTSSRHADFMKGMRGHPRSARASITLDETSEIAVTALLREASRICEPDGKTKLAWEFKEPPELAVLEH